MQTYNPGTARQIVSDVRMEVTTMGTDGFESLKGFLIYTQDLQRIVDFNMLSDTAIVVGDNVLRPGAPQFMYWNSVAGPYETQVVSLREYKQASSVECFQSLQTISWLRESSK